VRRAVRSFSDDVLVGFDRGVACVDLGCDPVRAFVAVTLPLILPAIAAGWMLAFTLSLDDLVIASFTTGPGSATLPIRIYSEVRLGVKLEINAICTLVIGLIAVVIVVASLTSKLSSSRGESPRHCSSRHCVRISPHPRSGRRPCSA
jgi:putrescine transport system permease protein